MDLYQLKTFVVVARERSITRASELLHLSQPAVSAHIKAIEDTVELLLFDRTPRGMSLTADGKRLLGKVEQTLGAHQELMIEARRLKGRLAGRLRIGVGANATGEVVGRLLATMAELHADVEVTLEHGTSRELLVGLRGERLDAALYNEGGAPDPDLTTVELSRFSTYVVAAPGLVPATAPLDWGRLAERTWIYPTANACCARTAESIFTARGIRPRRIIGVDRESVTRSLVAQGLGIGLLHDRTAHEACARGEVTLLLEAPAPVRVLFAHLATRAPEPVLTAARSIVRGPA